MASAEIEETSNLLVLNLRKDIKDSDLQDLFGPFGPIHLISLKTDSCVPAKVKAYIHFSHRKDAERAMQCLNGFCYENQILIVEWHNATEASNETNIQNNKATEKYVPPHKRTGVKFVQEPKQANEMATIRVDNLPRKLKSSHVQNMFVTFGPIARFYLPKDSITRDFKGFAFVKFHNCESAARAVELMNGFTYGDNVLQVKWVTKGTTNAKPEKELGRNVKTQNEPKLTVCVQNVPRDVGRALLLKLFKPFGEIRLVLMAYDKCQKFKGIAHIVFERHEHACHAIEFMNGFVYDNQILLVDWMLKPKKPRAVVRTNKKVEYYGLPTIIVENLPYGIKYKEVFDMFRAFGSVALIDVLKDNIKQEWSIAAISFRNQEDAVLAIDFMNGFIYANCTLKVKWEPTSEKRFENHKLQSKMLNNPL